MTSKRKSTRTAVDRMEQVAEEVTDRAVPVYAQSVERWGNLQKHVLDVAAEQGYEWMNMCQQMTHYIPQFPGNFMFDMYKQMLGNYVESHKEMIDMALDQNERSAEMVEERSGSLKQNASRANEWFQDSIDTTVAMQKKTLDLFAQQQRTAYEAMKRQFHLNHLPGAELLQNGVEMLMETQKAMLDVAAKPLYQAAEAA